MMQGIVNQNCEATLPIVLKNGTVTQLLETVIDTGFSGFLTLPLLRGYDLRIQTIEGGTVAIEALPNINES